MKERRFVKPKSYNIELKANILRLPSVSSTSFVKFKDKIFESKKFRKAWEKEKKDKDIGKMNLKMKNI